MVESPKDHYATTYTNTATGHTDDNTRAYDNGTIINTLTGETELNGTKVWMDGGAQSTTDATVTLTLHRTIEGSSEETFAENQLPDGATLTWNGDAFTIDNLPLYDNENYEYTYSVTGEASSGNVTISDVSTTKDTNAGKVTLSGSKSLDDAGSGHNNASEVSLTLYRKSKKEGSTAETVTVAAPIVLTWTGDNYKYSTLPKYDKEGYEYTYWVTEAQVEGFEEPEYDNGEGKTKEKALDHGQIINRKTGETDLTGTKTWNDGGNAHVSETEITLALHRQSAKGGAVEDVEVASPITFA